MTMKRAKSNKVFWLDALQWSMLKPHLPTKQTGPKRKDDRRIISGIIHILRLTEHVVLGGDGHSGSAAPPLHHRRHIKERGLDDACATLECVKRQRGIW